MKINISQWDRIVAFITWVPGCMCWCSCFISPTWFTAFVSLQFISLLLKICYLYHNIATRRSRYPCNFAISRPGCVQSMLIMFIPSSLWLLLISSSFSFSNLNYFKSPIIWDFAFTSKKCMYICLHAFQTIWSGHLTAVLWPLLLTWINLNPSMDKWLHTHKNVGWNNLSIPKLQWLHRWCLGMDNSFHLTLYYLYKYSIMPD